MKPFRIALLLFVTGTMTLMALFTAVVVWPYGWQYSSSTLLSAVGAIVFLWNGHRL